MIRIVTWNIAFGRRLSQVLEGLVTLPPPDLIALQELSIHEGVEDADVIAAGLGRSWRAGQVTAQMVAGRPQANGFVWNSKRVHVDNLQSIALPTPAGRMMRGLPKTQRTALMLEARIGQQRMRTYSVHLDVLGVAHKQAQLAQVLADATSRAPVDLALIAGDLNTYGVRGRPPWARLRRLVESADFEELTVRIGWTHRRFGLRQKLDAIFASPRGLPHQVQRAPLHGSDHVPVVAEVG